MAKPTRATQAKRQRERSQKENQQAKQERREIRAEEKKIRASQLAEGIDPDLVGIYPGPQSRPEIEAE
jgi:hypothetical protein